MHDPNTVYITVTFYYPAATVAVFDAWLTPELIGQWMFGPTLRDERIISIETDACTGGHFSFKVERAGQVLNHTGEYLDIDAPHKLEFTWAVGHDDGKSRVTVELAARSGGCELTLIHALHPDFTAYADRTQAGWEKMLAALEKVL